MTGNNSKRILGDVVSVDAWHTPFQAGVANIHVNAVFREARVGGSAASPVRFRLSLKRAEIVIIVPSSEPLVVKKSSVSRDQPLVKSVRVTEKSQKTSEGQAGISASARFPTAASLAVQAKASAGYNSIITSESEHQIEMFDITQSRTVDGHYRWDCVPSMGVKLVGRPWGASNTPRLSVQDTRDNPQHLEGAMRVEIRCKREDLSIEEIEIKNEGLLEKLKSSSLLRNKIAAVEAYLMHLLTEERLSFSNVSDPFGDLCVADVVIEEGSA